MDSLLIALVVSLLLAPAAHAGNRAKTKAYQLAKQVCLENHAELKGKALQHCIKSERAKITAVKAKKH